MQLPNRSRFARLGLESLEGRTLLSSTPLSPSPSLPAPVVSQASTMQVQQNTNAGFTVHWGVTPGAVLQGTNTTTGNGKSTGSVDFALIRDTFDSLRLGGPTGSIPIGFLLTTSSARAAHPDVFHTPFTLELRIRDAASGATGVLNFKGSINGTLTATTSSLAVTFQSPLTQKLTLGNHVYSVTLPSVLHPTSPGAKTVALYASMGVSNKARLA